MSKFVSGRTLVRVLVGVVAVGALIAGLDLLLTHGKTTRGTVVAGVDAGDLNPTQARAVIDELKVRSQQPVELVTDTGRVELPPAELGLDFDAEATYDALFDQPANPWDRALALVGVTHDLDPTVSVDRERFDEAIDGQRATLEQAAVEGGIRFEQSEPVPDMPAAGLRIARDQALEVLRAEWLTGEALDLPMEPFEPTVSADTVGAALAGPARRAMSAPLRLIATEGNGAAEDVRIDVDTDDLGALLSFVPDGKGGLVPDFDDKAAAGMLGQRLADSESEPVDATFALSGGRPSVVDSKDGSAIEWEPTLEAMAEAVTTLDRREVEVAYKVTEPELTTEDAEDLGVVEVVSEYTTGDFSAASGENIRLVAAEVDGAVVLPGETFSLNTHTGPRGTAQGYVDSTIIDQGRASVAVGGGISQFATTLYNAAYFAGLEDVDHTEHGYYITRYPEAREATVFEGAIDLVFRNNTDHGIVIDTSWSSSSVTVRLWSTKTVEVQSVTGQRHAFTDPEEVRVPDSDTCIASSGSRGFTTSDTRIITDARTGAEISRNTRTVRYDPEPIVRCI